MQNLFATPDMSTQDIQDLIDSAEGDTTIHLSEGTFTFTETLVIDQSNVSLVGAGDDQTIILADPSMESEPVIQLGHDLFQPKVQDEFKIVDATQAGSAELQLEAGHGLVAGDYIYVTQENTQELFDEIGDELWQKDVDLRTQLLKVESVEGDTINFESPLTFDFDPEITTIEHRDILEGNTLSGFTVQGSWGDADPAEFENTLGTDNGATAILVAGTSYAELSDISILDAASHGITVAGSTDIILTDILIDGAADKGGSGNGYGVWIRDVYDSDFSDLTITDTRHAVVFASYTSASGNVVDVSYTNRDINFHGGLDQDNIVSVDVSVRVGEETYYLSPALFFNDGKPYGAPTDPDANTVTFGTVVGTVRADAVMSSSEGSHIEVLGGEDLVVTGDGDDYVDLGTGNDLVFASSGNDSLIGGSADDTVVFAFEEAEYSTYWEGDTLFVTHSDDVTQLSGFEEVYFADTGYNFEDVPTLDGPPLQLWETSGDAGFEEVDGTDGWDRAIVDQSTNMGDQLEATLLIGTADVDVIGNDLDNNVLGNDGDNQIEVGAGDDRVFGRGGDDVIFGESGDDLLHGQAGDDVLIGSEGNDTLIGGSGSDTFVGTEGTNTIIDFSAKDGDKIQINSDTDGAFEDAFNFFLDSGESTNEFGFSIVNDDLEIQYDDGELIVKDLMCDDFLF